MRPLCLPQTIEKEIGNRCGKVNTIGQSGASVWQFEDLVLKVQSASPWAKREYTMLRWLDGRIPVPKVVAYQEEQGQSYLLMTRVPGRMACDSSFLDRPEWLASRLAEALLCWWSVQDLETCPFYRDTKVELLEAQERVERGLVDTQNVEPETFGPGGFRDPAALLSWLEHNQPSLDPVLSHGDFCLPNIFLTENGIGGFIDLGDAGVGDRWRDIALGVRSLRHNTDGTYGKKRGAVPLEPFFERLNLRPDWEKIKWYLLLDELF